MTDLDDILESAALAPSVHNTQPWRFETSRDAVDVVADRGRQLAFLDPTGRQLHVSCGAAVEFAVIAARTLGRTCEVALLPDPTRPDLLAHLVLRPGGPPTGAEQLLADAIPIRYTDRGPYTGEPVPGQVVSDAQRRATEVGAWLRRLDQPEQRRAVIAVLTAAEATEVRDPKYAEELARWTTHDNSAEGMPAAATAQQWPDDKVTDVPLRDFSGAGRHPHPADYETPPTVERDLLLLLGTELDDRPSWLAAGRALGWTLLRATADGVSAQPLGQAIDLQSGRDRLRHELGLVGHPQFVLRLGYGTGAPTTRRRAATP